MNVPEELKNSTILLVDDKLDNLNVLITHFKRSGFNIFVARSGEEALRIMGEVFPDIILLDILMPGKSGFDVIKEIKQSPELNEIPVIFLTALHETEHEVKGLEMGAVDYVTKPVKLETVMARVITHLTVHYQRKLLRDLNATKDRFFSIIGHDLRGPIGSIHTLVELMQEDYESYSMEEVKGFLALLNDSSLGVQKLLENLLEWSKVEKGTMPFQPEKLDSYMVTRNNLELFRVHASQKNIQLENNLSPQTWINADMHMFQTIIRNLVGNALKFTMPGGKVNIESKPYQSRFVEFIVSDTGIGMNGHETENLFNIGQKKNSRGTNGEKGSGLGLIICKGMIERHGGNIHVNSAPQKGTQFHFTLPVAEP